MAISVAGSGRSRRSRLRTPGWAVVGIAALAVTNLAACGGRDSGPAAYPDREITFVVPYTAGGPTDTVARLIAEPMGEKLGQQIVVKNVTGAGGTVAAGQVAAAKADGYEVLIHNIAMSTAPALYPDLPFEPLTDFKTVGLITDVPMTIVARKDFPPTTLEDLVTYVKSNAGTLTLAHAGGGSQLCGLLIEQAIGADLTEVPYDGTGPALTDLVGGQVDFMCDQTTNTAGQIRSGAIKAYAVTTPERVKALPDLPTTAEAGLPDVQVAVWHGLYVPAETPDGVVAKLTEALQVALADPNVIDKMADLGTTPVAGDQVTPDAHRVKLTQQIELWTPIIKGAGVKGG